MKKFNFLKGKQGEFITEVYLRKNGYKIIRKNFKALNTETDIIAKKDDDLVFIEVKSRNSFDYGRPSEAVDNKKIKKLRLNAKLFISKYEDTYRGIRFDVIEVDLTSSKVINHIKYAF